MVDWLRAVRYPPELVPDTRVLDLAAGQQDVVAYAVPPGSGYAIQLTGFSFTPVSGEAAVEVDGAPRALEWRDLRAARGLGREEEARATAWSSARITLTAWEAASGYAWRHSVLAFKPSAAALLSAGKPLAPAQAELAARFRLDELLAVQHAQPFPHDWGVEAVRVAAAPAVGTVLRAAPKPGRKLVLLGLAASGPGAVLAVRRDGDDTGVRVHTAALPGLAADPMRVRLVALTSLEVEAETPAGGVYVRVVYGEGRLNLLEKVLWGLKLSPEEEQLAARLDLASRVAAGAL